MSVPIILVISLVFVTVTTLIERRNTWQTLPNLKVIEMRPTNGGFYVRLEDNSMWARRDQEKGLWERVK